jgi:DNA-binding LacI/PurR family transcriptional regulator
MKLSSKKILEELRVRIGRLQKDDCFLSEAKLCEEFSISRMTANKINNQLVNEGLLYRIKGSGTYVKAPHAPEQAIRVLLPCPDYFLFDCTYNMRLLLAGMLDKAKLTNIRIQGVPVSKVNNPEKIDWDEFESFNSETIVLVSGLWFKQVFSFLHKRKCKVIFCDFNSARQADYPKYFSEWTMLRLDIQKEMADTVQKLSALGFKRIGYIYNEYIQDHPLNQGFKDGLKKARIKFSPEQAIYSENVDAFFETLQNASKNFDVLLLASPSLARQTLLILKSSGQKVPNGIAVVSFGDTASLNELNPPLSAVAVPFFKIGQNIIEALQNNELSGKNDKFKGQLFLRESLKLGAGKNVNPACNLENSEPQTKQFSFYSN